jgi:hypothetical protein
LLKKINTLNRNWKGIKINDTSTGDIIGLIRIYKFQNVTDYCKLSFNLTFLTLPQDEGEWSTMKALNFHLHYVAVK